MSATEKGVQAAEEVRPQTQVITPVGGHRSPSPQQLVIERQDEPEPYRYVATRTASNRVETGMDGTVRSASTKPSMYAVRPATPPSPASKSHPRHPLHVWHPAYPDDNQA